MRKSARAGAEPREARSPALNTIPQCVSRPLRRSAPSPVFSQSYSTHRKRCQQRAGSGAETRRRARSGVIAPSFLLRPGCHLSGDVRSLRRASLAVVNAYLTAARRADAARRWSSLMTRMIGVSLFALIIASSAQAQQIGDVFYIPLENHNWTQPSTVTGVHQIFGNSAAPFINSLVTPGNPNAAMTSYASNYQNVVDRPSTLRSQTTSMRKLAPTVRSTTTIPIRTTSSMRPTSARCSRPKALHGDRIRRTRTSSTPAGKTSIPPAAAHQQCRGEGPV